MTDATPVTLPKPTNALSAEAQHVIDSLEAHYNAVLSAAQTNGAAGLVRAVQSWGQDVLDRLEAWGVEFRQGAAAAEAALSAGQQAEAPAPGPAVKGGGAKSGGLQSPPSA